MGPGSAPTADFVTKFVRLEILLRTKVLSLLIVVCCWPFQSNAAERKEFSQTASMLDQVLTSVTMLPYSAAFVTLNAAFIGYQVLAPGKKVQQDASKTAEGVAHVRNMFSKMGLCNDNLAENFLRRSHHVHSALAYPYFWYWGFVGDFALGLGALAARSDLGDDIFLQFVEKAVQNPSEDYAVIQLGAGFDTRFYRFKDLLPSNLKVLELDIATTQAAKRQILLNTQVEHSHVHFVAIDFSREDLEGALTNTGLWHKDMPTLFLWEGVSMYIPEEHVNKTLEFVGSSKQGSEFYFDVLIDFFSEKAVIPQTTASYLNQKLVENKGESFQFGIKDPSDDGIRTWLGQRNLHAETIFRKEDLENRYFKRSDGSLAATCSDYVIFVHSRTF